MKSGNVVSAAGSWRNDRKRRRIIKRRRSRITIIIIIIVIATTAITLPKKIFIYLFIYLFIYINKRKEINIYKERGKEGAENRGRPSAPSIIRCGVKSKPAASNGSFE